MNPEHVTYDIGNGATMKAVVIGGGISPDHGVYVTVVPLGFELGNTLIPVDAAGTAYRITAGRVIAEEAGER